MSMVSTPSAGRAHSLAAEGPVLGWGRTRSWAGRNPFLSGEEPFLHSFRPVIQSEARKQRSSGTAPLLRSLYSPDRNGSDL